MCIVEEVEESAPSFTSQRRYCGETTVRQSEGRAECSGREKSSWALIGVSPRYTKVVGSIPGQGTHKNQPMSVEMGRKTRSVSVS